MNSPGRMMALMLALLVVALGLVVLLPGQRAAAGKQAPSTAAEAVAAGHARHLPPTLGSGRYQYSYPDQRRFDATQVYDPTPPPPGPAPDGVR